MNLLGNYKHYELSVIFVEFAYCNRILSSYREFYGCSSISIDNDSLSNKYCGKSEYSNIRQGPIYY